MTTPRAVPLGQVSWERMIQAVEKIRQRTLRAGSALESAGIPYAVVGGNAVAAHVSKVDVAAVRNTADVDILLARTDLARAAAALVSAGFILAEVAGTTMFLDGPDTGPRDALHVVFAGEKVQPDYLLAAPDVTESEAGENFRVLSLEALVRMKLTSFRDKDRTHLRDMVGVGLVDAIWVNRLPSPLAARLQQILDTPNG